MTPQLNEQNPLANLKDIHSPLEPSIWPPSWEFWLVFILLILCGVIGHYTLLKLRRPTWYKEAQQLIKQHIQSIEQQPSIQNIIALNQALKRIALSLYPRDEVAHLHGYQWCEWLNEKGKCNHFTQGVGQCLGDTSYNPNTVIESHSIALLQSILLEWLNTHKKQPTQKHLHTPVHPILHTIQKAIHVAKSHIKTVITTVYQKLKFTLQQDKKQQHQHTLKASIASTKSTQQEQQEKSHD